MSTELKLYPYWWERSPRPELEPADLPRRVDVAIVGSGYTGLNAALVTARSGRSTAIFDAEDAGFGCSTRNGGQISTSIKPGLAELSRRHGRETGLRIAREGQNALDWIADFTREENLDCDFQETGAFHAAHSEKAFKKLVSEVQNQPTEVRIPARVVSRAEQHSELGTDAYHGGVVFERHASLDPGRYHQQLLERVLSIGVNVHAHCPVDAIEKNGNGFRVKTRRGVVEARDVVIATNGYTGQVTPWHRRRVIPIGSYIIATDAIETALMDQLMPTDRILSDTRKVVYYYRPSPDRSRVLFGGRVSCSETDPRKSAPLLKRDLVALFPELENVGISHSWMGFVAYTFDTLAHAGTYGGMHYAMGYCGSGVSMASYLGMRVGQQVLGLKEGRTGTNDIVFPTRPLYNGKPWFLSAAVSYYRWRDRIQ